MSQKHIEDRVRHIDWPGPSPDLRDRVLSSAIFVEHSITWSDRVWFSRAWRLSAAAAALTIVLLDQFSGSQRPAGFTASAQALAEAQVIDETGRQVGLPPDLAQSLARRSMAEASRAQEQPRSASAFLQALELQNTGGEQ
jgi:hypothetical protein